ncbi:hypothetical protein BKI52_15855 [marine bacterium AO1-C]|nr:hypothetical protein BKI52_15855 [marine bacterium AO1-C]
MNQLNNKIKGLISKNQLEKAFGLLEQHTSQDLNKAVFIQKSLYLDIKAQWQKNDISLEQYAEGKNKVVLTLLELADQVTEPEPTKPEPTKDTAEKTEKSQRGDGRNIQIEGNGTFVEKFKGTWNQYND